MKRRIFTARQYYDIQSSEESIEALSRRYHCRPATIKQVRSAPPIEAPLKRGRRGRPPILSIHQKDQIEKVYTQKPCSAVDIARAIGVSSSTVRKALQERGISLVRGRRCRQ